MSVRAIFNRVSVAVVVGAALAQMVPAQSVTRAEALQIGESYVNHRWTAGSKNVRHGKDAAGIQIHTPDRASGHGNPATDCWVIDDDNTGVAYKWGGFDTPERFSAGVKAGKAAGDIYNAEKRRLGGAAVSGEATGVDCSGFVSRCWKLSSKHSTSMLAGICQKLDSPASLKPADVMNTAAGHVLLFVRWLDDGKKRALFYEAAPYSKTRSTERDVAELAAAGFVPLRYRRIKD
jgi:hypothetical protein